MDQVQNRIQICAAHKREATFLRLKKQDNLFSYQLCDICILKLNNEEQNDKISIKEVKEIQEPNIFQIIHNWPLGLESAHFDNLQEFMELNFQHILSTKLDKFMEQLRQEFNEKIKQIITQYIERIKEVVPENNLKEDYDTKFQKQQLIEVVNNFESSNYEEFLTNFEDMRIVNLRSFIDQIEKVKSCAELISFDQPNEKKQEIFKILSEMNFFSEKQLQALQIPNNINQQIPMRPVVNEKEKPKVQENMKDEENYLAKLLEMNRQFNEIGFENSITFGYLDQNFNKIKEQFYFGEVFSIFKQFPVFDICARKFPKDITQDIELIKTKLNNGQNQVQITKNIFNQFETFITESSSELSWTGTNCISNLTLSKNDKYVFRILIKSEGPNPMIGLMSSINSNTKNGYEENLSFHLRYQNGMLIEGNDNGISQKVKGDDLVLPNEIILEMRVWQEGQLLEVLTYPDYKYQVALKDEYKQNLKEKKDLKLYLLLYDSEIKYTLLETLIVDRFED